jgi:hypothetical protein
MYICKFQAEKNIKQMELTDYFGTSRKVVFDMNDPKDIRKAQKAFEPKGLEKKTRKRSGKNKKEIQPKLDQFKINSRPTTNHSITTEPHRNLINEQQKVEQKEKKQIKRSEKTIKITNTGLNQPSPTELVKSSNVLSQINELIQKPISTTPLNTSFLSSVGFGGNLVVLCPFCQEEVNFSPDDLDMPKLSAARVCDGCGAFLRISIRGFHKNIFSDLKIPFDFIQKNQKHSVNSIQDESNNIIYSYGLRLQKK